MQVDYAYIARNGGTMDTPNMTDRHNRTIYIRDFLMGKANDYGKRSEVDRSGSRIIEMALTEFFQNHQVDLSDDPLKGSPDSD
jgi:hypothetical protein